MKRVTGPSHLIWSANIAEVSQRVHEGHSQETKARREWRGVSLRGERGQAQGLPLQEFEEGGGECDLHGGTRAGARPGDAFRAASHEIDAIRCD